MNPLLYFCIPPPSSLPSFLCPDDTPKTFLDVSLITSAILSMSSVDTFLPPRACRSSSLNSVHHSSSLSIYNLILLHLLPIHCCLATCTISTTLKSPIFFRLCCLHRTNSTFVKITLLVYASLLLEIALLVTSRRLLQVIVPLTW